MKKLMSYCVLLIVSVASSRVAANESELIPFTEIRVKQFARFQSDDVVSSTPDAFKSALAQACSGNSGVSPAAAPFVSAIGGIVVDWLFSRAANKLNEKLKKRIEQHSASYSNTPMYSDMYSSELWTASGESCMVMQRIECEQGKSDVENGLATCGQKGEVALSIGVKIRSDGNTFRVLPIAINLIELKPLHDKGIATVAATFRLTGVGFRSGDGVGYSWNSDVVSLGSLECELAKNRKPHKGKVCERLFPLSPQAWIRAAVLPLPPRQAQAAVFTVGEVGEPSSGLKGFSEFLDATKDDLSGALSEAFQKKIKLAED